MRVNDLRPLLLGTVALVILAGCAVPLVPSQLTGQKSAQVSGSGLEAGWVAYPDAIQARSNAAGVAVGFSWFILGGKNASGTTLATTECFTGFDKWSAKASMPTPRTNLAAAIVPSNRVLALGGIGSEGISAIAEMYSFDQNTWERLPAMPTARSDSGATANGVFAYVAGGKTQAGPSKAFETFDIRDRSWKRLPDLRVAREGCVAAALGQRVAVVGGNTGNGVTNALELYNPATGTWSQGAPMPTARSHAAFAIYGHHLFVLGGRTSNGATDAVESYDLASNTWTTRTSLPQALQGAIATKLGERLVVSGGSADGRPSAKTWGMPFPF